MHHKRVNSRTCPNQLWCINEDCLHCQWVVCEPKPVDSWKRQRGWTQSNQSSGTTANVFSTNQTANFTTYWGDFFNPFLYGKLIALFTPIHFNPISVAAFPFQLISRKHEYSWNRFIPLPNSMRSNRVLWILPFFGLHSVCSANLFSIYICLRTSSTMVGRRLANACAEYSACSNYKHKQSKCLFWSPYRKHGNPSPRYWWTKSPSSVAPLLMLLAGRFDIVSFCKCITLGGKLYIRLGDLREESSSLKC